MNLHTLSSHHRKNKQKRKGRGNGSGKGNYSTRGLKGQNSRSGSSSPARFEGNQTPLFMRLPKRKGFTRPEKFRVRYVPVSLARLETTMTEKSLNDTVTKEFLHQHGYIRKNNTAVKIVGSLTQDTVLSFENIDAFSVTAEKSIVAAGGSIA